MLLFPTLFCFFFNSVLNNTLDGPIQQTLPESYLKQLPAKFKVLARI